MTQHVDLHSNTTSLIRAIKADIYHVMAAASSVHMPTQNDHFGFPDIKLSSNDLNSPAVVILVGNDSAHSVILIHILLKKHVAHTKKHCNICGDALNPLQQLCINAFCYFLNAPSIGAIRRSSVLSF